MKNCEVCSKEFSCGASSGQCWCMDLPKIEKVAADLKDCLCPDCLMVFAQKKSATVATEDYYFENGLMVFTEKYLLKRGHCCESGCRHCPYAKSK